MKNATGASFVTAVILAAFPASADSPVVTKLEPSQGFVEEDTEVTLTGDGFDVEASVLVAVGGPFLVGSYGTPGRAIGVAVSGDYAYVVDGYRKLQVIDIRNAQAPALAGRCDTPGYAFGVEVAGGYADVADLYSGLDESGWETEQDLFGPPAVVIG